MREMRVCRTCSRLISEQHATKIEEDSFRINLPQILKECVPELQFKVLDSCLCYKCFSLLYLFQDFRKTCLETEAKIRDYVKRNLETNFFTLLDVFASEEGNAKEAELRREGGEEIFDKSKSKSDFGEKGDELKGEEVDNIDGNNKDDENEEAVKLSEEHFNSEQNNAGFSNDIEVVENKLEIDFKVDEDGPSVNGFPEESNSSSVQIVETPILVKTEAEEANARRETETIWPIDDDVADRIKREVFTPEPNQDTTEDAYMMCSICNEYISFSQYTSHLNFCKGDIITIHDTTPGPQSRCNTPEISQNTCRIEEPSAKKSKPNESSLLYQALIAETPNKCFYPCNFCHYKSKSRGNLQLHINYKHARMFQCSSCSYSTFSELEFARHGLTHL